MPTPRLSLALAFADGRFYAFGGSDSGGNVLSTVEAYDPSTNTWSTPSDSGLNEVCNLGAVTGGDGRAYVIGGMEYNCNTEPGWRGLDNVSAHSPASNKWAFIASLPTTPEFENSTGAATSFGCHGSVYSFEGDNNDKHVG